MRFALKSARQPFRARGGDASDRVISAMTRLTPNPVERVKSDAA